MVDLSIVIPVYNVEKYLSQCIDSLLRLEGVKYELIIVNDGSTDGSEDVIIEYLGEAPEKIRYIKQSNCGLSAARNTGLKNATGKYLIFIDSDDYVIPERLKDFWEKAQNAEADIAIANFEKDIEGVIKKHRFNFSKSLSIRKKALTGRQYLRYMYDYFFDGFDCEAVTQIYNVDFLRKNNITFFEGIIHEDTLFAFEVFRKAKSVVVFNIPFYRYRMRAGSIMHSIDKRHYESIAIILEKVQEMKRTEKYNMMCVDSYIVSSIYELGKYYDGEIMKRYIPLLQYCKRLTAKSFIKKLVVTTRF